MIEIEEMIKKMTDSGPTVADHYGVKLEEVTKLQKELLCSMIMSSTTSETLDKFFPKLTAEERVKVVVYARAKEMFEKMEQ